MLAAFQQLASHVASNMVIVQNDSTAHVRQEIDNISNGLDFFSQDNLFAGQVSTVNPHSSFVSVGYRKNVATRLTRPGQFRLSGINADVSDGNDIASGAILALGNLGDSLAQAVVYDDGEGNSLIWNPVVVKTSTITTPPTTLTLQPVLTVTATKITTQNSRKPR